MIFTIQKILNFILFCCILFSCKNELQYGEVSKKDEGFILNFLKKESKIKTEGKVMMILLHASNCSCKDKNIEFAEKILNSKPTTYEEFLVIKDDKSGKIISLINLKGINFINDTLQLLEKHGNVLINDKIFFINNQKIEKVFDLDEGNMNLITEYISKL